MPVVLSINVKLINYTIMRETDKNKKLVNATAWLWIGVSVLVILIMVWLTIFEYWSA